MGSRIPLFKKGDFVHYLGWGLAKVVSAEKYTDTFAGQVYRYRVNTKTYPKQKFHFGIKTAYDHELRKVSDSEAKRHIQRRKEGF
jgi:hypothetical protein